MPENNSMRGEVVDHNSVWGLLKHKKTPAGKPAGVMNRFFSLKRD
jgi:hypothetical protein